MEAEAKPGAGPFHGPKPFESGDSDSFYGRTRETADLVSLIVANPAVLLYAQSGAGKTSLIEAGVLPELRHRTWDVLPVVRFRNALPLHLETSTDINPFISDTIAILDGKSQVNHKQSLGQYLEQLPITRGRRGQPYPRLLVFDQFEEFFRVHRDQWELREDFFEQVVEVISDPRLSTRVLFSMREEFIARLDRHPILEDRLRTRFHLDRLRAPAALAALTRPLPPGCTFAPGVAESLIGDLLKTQVETSVGGQPEIVEVTGEFVEPVQLQVVGQSLWNALPAGVTVITGEHRDKYGQVDAALERYYASAVHEAVELQSVEAALRRWCGEDLINSSTGTPTRTFATQETAIEREIPQASIDRLVDTYHLVRMEDRPGSPWYELSHDRLIAPVLADNATWFDLNLSPMQRQAQIWDRDQKESYLLNSDGLANAEEWLKTYQGVLLSHEELFLEKCREREQRRLSALARDARERRRLRIGIVVAATFAVLAIAAAIAALVLRGQAEEARDDNRTQSERYLAELLLGSTIPDLILRHHDDTAVLLARTAFFLDPAFVAGDEESIAIMNDALDADPFAVDPFAAVTTFQQSGAIRTIAFRDDGKEFAVAGDDGVIRLFDASSYDLIQEHPVRDSLTSVTSISVSSDGVYIAVGGCAEQNAQGICDRGGAYVWRPDNTEEPFDLPAAIHPIEGEIESVIFVPSRHVLLASGSDGIVRQWDLDGERTFTRDSDTEFIGGVKSLAVSADGLLLAAGGQCAVAENSSCSGGRIIILPVADQKGATGSTAFVLDGPVDSIHRVAFDKLSGSVAGGSSSGEVWLWTKETTGQPTYTGKRVERHAGPVLAISFSPDGTRVVSSGLDYRLRIYHLDGTLPVIAPTGQSDTIFALAFNPADTNVLITGNRRGYVQRWEFARPVAVPGSHSAVHDGAVWAAAVSADGELIAVGGDSGQLSLWNATTLEQIWSGATEGNRVYAIAITPDKTTMAVGHIGGAIVLWNITDPNQPKRMSTLSTDDTDVRSLAIDSEGQLLASGSWSGAVQVWKLAAKTGESPTSVTTEPFNVGASVRAVAFRPGEPVLAIGSCEVQLNLAVVCPGGGILTLWDYTAGTGQAVAHSSSSIYSIDFSPDGQKIALGLLNGEIEQWDVSECPENCRRIGEPLEGHLYSVRSVNYGPDGEFLVTSSDDGTLRVWDFSDGGSTSFLLAAEPDREMTPIRAAVLSQDGTWVAFGNNNGLLRVVAVDADPKKLADSLAEQVCARVGRGLTRAEIERYLGNTIDDPQPCN